MVKIATMYCVLIVCQVLLRTLYTWSYFFTDRKHEEILFFFYHFCYTAMGAKAQRRMVSYSLGPGTFLAIHKWMLIKQIDRCMQHPWSERSDSGIKAQHNERVI